MTDETAERLGRTVAGLLRPRATREERRTLMASLFTDLKRCADPHAQQAEWRCVFAAALGVEDECNG